MATIPSTQARRNCDFKKRDIASPAAARTPADEYPPPRIGRLHQFNVIPLNVECNRTLHRLNRDDQLATALLQENTFQSIETSANNAYAPSGFEERIGRPRNGIRLQT